jgi:hypothetical protein
MPVCLQLLPATYIYPGDSTPQISRLAFGGRAIVLDGNAAETMLYCHSDTRYQEILDTIILVYASLYMQMVWVPRLWFTDKTPCGGAAQLEERRSWRRRDNTTYVRSSTSNSTA